jgi:hypothetical protein
MQGNTYGVAKIVIQRNNERLLKCCSSRGIRVPEQKRDIVKTLKMLRLRVFWAPWLAPYPILFYFILFYSILCYSMLFYSILFFSILFYSILFYSTVIYEK